jgi:hypothetical protein
MSTSAVGQPNGIVSMPDALLNNFLMRMSPPFGKTPHAARIRR